MANTTKKRQQAEEKIDRLNLYTLRQAMALVKEVNTAGFDASVDMHIRLGVDPRQADQAIRGTTVLPHGTGKTKRVLVFCTPDKEDEAIEAGADYVGLDEYIQKVNDGWTEFDVVVAMPSVMSQIGRLGRILGPRGLMPSPKTGTVTDDIEEAVSDLKKGKIAFRVDRYGIIHSSVGRVSFSPEQLTDNGRELLDSLMRLRPPSAGGNYVRTITVASTMSPGIKVNTKNYNIDE